MRLEITRLEGLRNDLVLRLERGEIDRAILSMPHRGALMALPGMPRHRAATSEEGRARGERFPKEQTLLCLPGAQWHDSMMA